MTTQTEPGATPPDHSQADDGLTGRAQEQVQSAAEQARARAREQIDQRASDLGAGASTVAGDLRSVAEVLRSQGRQGAAGLIEQAAQRVTAAGEYLQGADGTAILHDAESLGRRRPWAAITGGLATGIAASRFLKASSRERYETVSRVGSTARAGGPTAPRPFVTGSDPLAAAEAGSVSASRARPETV